MATQFLLKDKIKATKYYETDTPIDSNTGNNEADICLSLINSVKPTVNTTTFLGGEELTTPGKNFKFTDPTGSICSQTFAIASVHNVNENFTDEIVKNNILIGIDKNSNPINTFISNDSTSEPFLDNYLKIEITKNLGPFNSTASLFQATFKEDSSDLLSMAVNSAYNKDYKNGLLKIAEDTTHNNLYALGKDTSKYFTENANSKQLEVHDILSENRVSTNRIDIQTIPNSTPFNDENFGTFKFVTAKAIVNITTSADVTTLPLLLADDTDTRYLPSSFTPVEYKELFGDTITSFKIDITKNQNTGFNFANSSDNNYANFNNSTIVDNVDYIQNIANLSHSLEISQEPMKIDSDISNSNNNSSHFSLSTNGEKLSSTDYNTDGEIKIDFDASNNRITNVTSSNAFKVIVEYDNLTEELKTTKDVSYELIDYLLPTGQGQYDSFADSNGTSLYVDMSEYSTFDFTSSIYVNNSIKLIKITPTFNVDAVIMYKLNDDDSLGDVIPVDISATLSSLSNIQINTEVRAKLSSKKISDLGIQSINGSNDLLIQDITNPTIVSNKWNLYFDPEYSNEYLMSSLLATSNTSNFPSVDKSTSIINNDETLDVTLSYVSVISSTNTGMLFDSVNIIYDNITTEISQQSLEFFNESPKINYYELLPSVSDTNGVYQIVKYVITEQYQSKFMFPLSIFGNILMTTPLLNSVITTYLYYSQDTVITIGANNDTMTVSKSRILTPLVPSDITKLYKSTDVISLASNTNDNVVLNFSINKKSLTPLNAVFQIKTTETSSWENIGNIITDIDTYYGAIQTITNQLGHSVDIIICPTITTNTDETLQLINETYIIPLQPNMNNLQLSIKGYDYPVYDSLSLDVLTDPNYFINNDLPIGTDMNLSFDYTATLIGSNEYSIIINVKDGIEIIATINMDITSFFSAFVIAKNLKPYFYVDKTLGAQTSTRHLIIGDESVSNGYQSGISSGVLDMTDGVKINYTDLRQDEYLKFNLLPDKISVSHVGSAGTPQYITHLDYESTNCEKVSIIYYRGYLNNNTTQTYKIVRKDLVTAKVKATDTYVSNITGVHFNKEQVINFNDTISIENKVKLLFSRLPNNVLQNNKYIMNINVVGDSVKITIINNNIETVINKTLLDYLLYDFNTGTQLFSKRIKISDNLQYSIVYKEIGGKIYFVHDYKTNPSNIIWPSEEEYIVNLDEIYDVTLGTIITNTELDENGYIKFTLSKDTLLDKISYLVYAPPYLYATQATKYASNVFPFNIANSANELKTVYFPTTNYSGTELNQTKYLYEPFANILNTNNVTFTPTTIKSFADYNNSSKNTGVQTINITGAHIKLTELKTNNSTNTSNNGPNHDGIIYNGTIGDLTNFSSNYIKLLSNDNGVFQINYTQDLEGLFGQTLENNSNKYRGNIVINIGNSVLPNTFITLHNQVKNGSIISIYDVYQVNHNNTLELYLLKYVYDTLINYTNVSGNAYLKRFPGEVYKLYYSQVQIPSINLGDNINDVLKNIIKSNLSLDSSNNIVWTEKIFFSNNLSLQITPLTQDGAVDMITLFYTSKEVPINYTIMNIPNAYEVINGDGTYQTIITGLGKIKTQLVNTSNTPANINIDLSLPNSLTSNYAYNNSALYDNDIPLDTQLKSIDDILFKFE